MIGPVGTPKKLRPLQSESAFVMFELTYILANMYASGGLLYCVFADIYIDSVNIWLHT